MHILLFLLINRERDKVVNYEVYYDFVYQISEEPKRYSRSETYLLYGDRSISRFLNANQHLNDSIHSIFTAAHPDPSVSGENFTQEKSDQYIEQFMKFRQAHPPISLSSEYIIEKLPNRLTKNLAMFSLPRRFLKEYLSFEWKLESQSEAVVIHGVRALKAYTTYGGREWVVWYSPEIPINDGPYVFRGLSGLILKAEDTEGRYLFVVKSLSTSKKGRFWRDDLFDKYSHEISRADYIKKMYVEKNDPPIHFGILSGREEMKLKLLRERESRYDLLLEKE